LSTSNYTVWVNFYGVWCSLSIIPFVLYLNVHFRSIASKLWNYFPYPNNTLLIQLSCCRGEISWKQNFTKIGFVYPPFIYLPFVQPINYQVVCWTQAWERLELFQHDSQFFCLPTFTLANIDTTTIILLVQNKLSIWPNLSLSGKGNGWSTPQKKLVGHFHTWYKTLDTAAYKKLGMKFNQTWNFV
jgi:hypothetical protein